MIEHFKGKDTANVIGVFLTVPAAALLLVFVNRLRAGIDDRARAARSLLVGGGVVYAMGLLVGASVILAVVVASTKVSRCRHRRSAC